MMSPTITAGSTAMPVRGVPAMTSPGGLAFTPSCLLIGPRVNDRVAFVSVIGPCVGDAGWPSAVLWHRCTPRRDMPGWVLDALADAGVVGFGLSDDEAVDRWGVRM